MSIADPQGAEDHRLRTAGVNGTDISFYWILLTHVILRYETNSKENCCISFSHTVSEQQLYSWKK